MKIQPIIIAIFCFAINYSQDQKNVESQFLVNALWPGISYELAVDKNITLKFDAATSLGVISFDNSGFDLFPRFDVQLRSYYNFERRIEKGKTTSGNSGNYYGIHSYYASDTSLLGNDFEPDLANIIVFGPASFETLYVGATFGMQRTYQSGFNWGMQFGLGIINVDFDNNTDAIQVTREVSLYPNFRVTIGWVIRMKKK